MPELTLDRFEVGYHEDHAPGEFPPGAATSAKNLLFDRKSLRLRPGRTNHSAVPVTAPVLTAGIRALAEYVPPADGSGNIRLVAAIGSKLYATNNASQTFAAYLEMSTTLASATCRVRFQQFRKHLYWVDGTEPLKRAFNLTGAATQADVEELEGLPVPQYKPTVTMDDEGSGDYLQSGHYTFALGYAALAYSPTGPAGERVSVYVPANTYRQIVVQVPDPGAAPSGGERIELYALTPYNANPDYWIKLRSILIATPVYSYPQGHHVHVGTGPGTANLAQWARAANVVTLTTGAAHGFAAGDTVTIAGADAGGGGTNPNGSFTILTVPTTTSFTFAQTAANDSKNPSVGTASLPLLVDLDSGTWTERDVESLDPPTGCHLIAEWQDRLVLAGPAPFQLGGPKNTLYLSDLGDPTKFRVGVYVDPPADYGGYITVGTQELTALFKIGSTLGLASKGAVWVLDGTDWSNWRLMQVSDQAGCATQETARSGDNDALFQGRGSVWRIDGGLRVVDVGADIRNTLSGLSETGQAAAFAEIAKDDRGRRHYVLGFPTATSSYAYALDLLTGAWTPLATMPDACLLYADRVATPGTYGGQDTGGLGGGKLYRIFAGNQDESSDIAWEWWSDWLEPFPGQYVCVERVSVRVLSAAVATDTITLKLRVNGVASDAASKAVTVPAATGVPKRAKWRPALIPDVNRIQIGLTGTGRRPFELGPVLVDVTPKGRVR